ncbi:hypothetical protein CL673_09100 [Candidatus Bathyarchaeota archaeon]|nr:hypothetical protein [Candidatus Bathyarchaeota archaeon]
MIRSLKGELGIGFHHGIRDGIQLKTYAKAAEEHNYNSIWVTERYFAEETFSLLGALAVITKKPKLGLAVTNPYTRHPALLSMAAATVDRLSKGRLILGLGRSERGLIEGQMKIPWGNPLKVLSDTIEANRRLLRGENVTMRSHSWQLSQVSLNMDVFRDEIPLYLAATGPKTLALAADLADGVVLNAYSPVRYVKYAVEFLREKLKESGRSSKSFAISCVLATRLTDDPSSVIESCRGRLSSLLSTPGLGELLVEKGGYDKDMIQKIRRGFKKKNADGKEVPPELVEEFYVIGDSKKCKERIEEYRRAGVTLPILLPRLSEFLEVARELSP